MDKKLLTAIKIILDIGKEIKTITFYSPALDEDIFDDIVGDKCMDSIFDLLDIPKDTTLECKGEAHKFGKECSLCFCRDWYTSLFVSYIDGKITFKKFINEVEQSKRSY